VVIWLLLRLLAYDPGGAAADIVEALQSTADGVLADFDAGLLRQILRQ